MSAFLGPIHYWLYEKIRVISQREDYIYEKAAGMCGQTAKELREQVWQTYGMPLPDTDLSELIDPDNSKMKTISLISGGLLIIVAINIIVHFVYK